MNRTDLIEKVVESTGITKKVATEAVSATFDAIKDALVSGDKVQILGFGTFETRERAARTGKNPQTGEAVEIPACKSPAFKAGKGLKEAVNK